MIREKQRALISHRLSICLENEKAFKRSLNICNNKRNLVRNLTWVLLLWQNKRSRSLTV